MSISGPRLSIIPAWVIADPRLKGAKDLQVLAMLGSHANTRHGWCRRSQVKLAEQLGCSRSTVQAAINRLVEMGAIERREVVSESGRDSAHWYRVVYDSVVDSSALIAWDSDDKEEFDPNGTFENDTPPAGISAPPADLRPAPPAGPGSAPINASTLTPPAEREERERDREDEGEENPKALEKRFRKWWKEWPTYATDTEATTRRAWLDLTPEQRKACEERTADYLAAVKASGRKWSKAAATYLSERAWERLADKPAASGQGAAPEAYTAYSRAGRALLFAELLRPMRQLMLNRIEEAVIAADEMKAEMIWRDKREKQGWPEAVKLIETTVQHRRFNVPARIVEIAQDFEKVRVGSPEWEAWRRLHELRCWPWLQAPDRLDWMQFPRLAAPISTDGDLDWAVEQALSDFEGRLREVRGDDDAA